MSYNNESIKFDEFNTEEFIRKLSLEFDSLNTLFENTIREVSTVDSTYWDGQSKQMIIEEGLKKFTDSLIIVKTNTDEIISYLNEVKRAHVDFEKAVRSEEDRTSSNRKASISSGNVSDFEFKFFD